jgi:hypothetical protein
VANKTAAPVDTTAALQTYTLATAHRAQLDPRLPSGTLDDLGADLTTLGATLPAASPPTSPSPPPPAAPSLPEAVATLANLVSAIHEAVRGSAAKPAVQKAYGATSKAAGKEVKPLLAAADKITTEATAHPAEALSLGILPADVAALGAAVSAVIAAEAQAQALGTEPPTAKAKRAAETRMHEAVARVVGVGALAFAQNAPVRAQFEALRPKRA